MVRNIQIVVLFISLICSFCNGQPAAPTGLIVTSARSNQLTISWTDTPGANHKVYVGTATGTEADAIDTTDNPYTAIGTSVGSYVLISNSQYNVAVYAVDALDSSLVSPALSGIGITVYEEPLYDYPSNPTTNSIDFTWDPPYIGGGAVPITGYRITYGSSSMDVPPTPTNITIDSLESSTPYAFTIAAISFAGRGDVSGYTDMTTYPDKVVLAANTTTATNDTIVLNWFDVGGGPRYYFVTWTPDTNGGGLYYVVDTTVPVMNLIASTRYTFQVVAKNHDFDGEVSDLASYSTLPNAPAAPSLSPGSDATSTIVVSWTAPTGGNDIVDYVVEWTANFASATKVATGNSTTLTTLPPGELYSVNVKARNSAGAGAKSPSALHRTNPAQPNKPTVSLSVMTDPTTSLVVTWVKPAGVVDTFGVTLYNEGNINDPVTGFPQNETGLTATYGNLIPGKLYTATVVAYSGGLAGLMSDASDKIRTNPPKPNAVTLSQPTSDKTTSLEVTWSMIGTEYIVSSYIINLTPANSGSNAPTVTYTATSTDPTNTLVGGLTPGESYTATVQAVSNNPTPESKSEISVPSASQRTDPPTPTIVTLSVSASSKTTSLVVAWSMPHGYVVSSYLISITAVGMQSMPPVIYPATSADPTVYTVGGLTPGEDYTATVQANSGTVSSCMSGASPSQRTAPPQPTHVILTQSPLDPTTSLIVNWTMPTIPFVVSSYEITLSPPSGSPYTYSATATYPTTYTVVGLTPAQSYMATVQAISNDEFGDVSDASPSKTTSTCPLKCEGCMGPCSFNSTGGCDCSCIDGYFPTQLDCQPVVCKEETLVHPTLLINVTFPTSQAGFKSSSLETCDNETVNGGKPYGTRSCLLNGTSTTPVWLTSCNTGLQSLANVTINSTEERVTVANDLEVLTSNPESLSSDDVTNTVQALDNVLDAPSITTQVSSSVITTVSNVLNVPDDVFIASNGSNSLLLTVESLGRKVELDENGVYEDVSSNVGMAVVQPSVGGIGRIAFGVDNLPINIDLGFRSDQVHLLSDEQIPENITAYISLPSSAALDGGTPKRISFLAYSNDKLFISPNGTYDDINSIVVISAAIEGTPVKNLSDPVIIQLMTNVTLNNESDGRLSSCVFWDEGNQSWTNGDVDSKVEETSDSVVCHFNHLTNFATLLARDDTGIVNTKALDIVSIVGSSISSFCLLLTILSFVCVPKLRIGGKMRGAVLLVNLSMALLLLNLLLIFSEQSFVHSSPDSCLAVGVLLHFSILASFAWTTVEAVNMCLVFVTPLYNHAHVNDKTVFILSHIWGWFVPSLFVAITCGVDLDLYRRSDEECWMQPNMILYLVLIPMIIVLTFNFIAYVAVLVASVSANRMRKKHSSSGSKSQVLMSVTLFMLLGLTWVFGFGVSGTDDSAVVFGYIFAVLNSLQGFFIFCLFIVRNKATRMEIKNQARKGIATAQQTIDDFTSQYQLETVINNKKYKSSKYDNAETSWATCLTDIQ